MTSVIAGSIDIAMTNGTLGAIAAFSWLAALEHSGDTDKRRRAQTLPAYAATKKWWLTQFAIEQISDLPRQVTST